MQQDYLVRQAEQIGHALAIILSKLLGLKSQPQKVIEIQNVNQMFDEQFEFNIDDLLAISKENIVGFLENNKEKMNRNDLETLSTILTFLAKETDSNLKKELYERSLSILEHLDNSDPKTYSLSRKMRIAELNNLISLQD